MTERSLEGKYEILGKLEEGGMGAVYKVRHRLLDEVRVIKILQPRHADDETLRQRFLREARTAIRLRHPNVVQLLDFSCDDAGTGFLVLEYVDGVTLQALLERSEPPSVALGVEIAWQGLAALGFLHGEGILHRDVSPDNLMVGCTPQGVPFVKLIDLGIAKAFGAEGSLTRTGSFLGKVRYSAPEQFARRAASAVLDERSDLYSFGVLFYELLTGRFPIAGKDFSQLVAGHLFHPPLDFSVSDPHGRLEEGLRATLLKALAKKPEDRFQSCAELAERLAVFRGEPRLADRELRELLGLGPPEEDESPATVGRSLPRGDTTALIVISDEVLAAEEPGRPEPGPGPIDDALRAIRNALERGDRKLAAEMIRFARSRFGDLPELDELI